MTGKPPPNLPVVGNRVRLRGRVAYGELRSVNDIGWARVAWDNGIDAPHICHLHELERVG